MPDKLSFIQILAKFDAFSLKKVNAKFFCGVDF